MLSKPVSSPWYEFSMRFPKPLAVFVVASAIVAAPLPCTAADTNRWFIGRQSRGLSHGTPQNQAAYQPGKSPYKTGIEQRPKYFVPPTNPRTPTSKMYGTPPGLVPGDWPSYAPFGFGGYRFPAVGAQAYR